MIFPNAWVFPGGHLDPLESLEEGGAREVNEETGIYLKPEELKPLMIFESASGVAKGTDPVRSGHLIFFFTVVLE